MLTTSRKKSTVDDTFEYTDAINPNPKGELRPVMGKNVSPLLELTTELRVPTLLQNVRPSVPIESKPKVPVNTFPEGEFILVQLPPIIPLVPLEEIQDEGVEDMDVAKGKAEEGSSSSSVEPTDSEFRKSLFENAKQTLPGCGPGQVGQLVEYNTGEVQLVIGDIAFDVRPGVQTSFFEQVACIHTEGGGEGEARQGSITLVGELCGRTVVVPNSSILDA